MGKTHGHSNHHGGVPKGAKRPKKPGDMKRGQRGGYQLAGGVPWPEYADGTPYTVPGVRVQHADFPDWHGELRYAEFRGPDGEHLEKWTKKATKTKPESLAVEGSCWWGVVSWDRPDDPERPLTRIRLKSLLPEA